MVGPDQALEIAQAFLDGENLERYGYTPMVDTKSLSELDGNYVVAWNTETYLRTRDLTESLAGNIPLFIDGASGECRYATDEESRRYFRG
ncbi:YrhB domain-containing protein [Streptacidiphilus monticola]|jgi:hypothetical protein|uniref:YrhB domain-containing protein n=1 Tax=Streptacidiphilus monticola TaxID=2161674 RepID=A0ABW1G260_9ACTN